MRIIERVRSVVIPYLMSQLPCSCELLARRSEDNGLGVGNIRSDLKYKVGAMVAGKTNGFATTKVHC